MSNDDDGEVPFADVELERARFVTARRRDEVARARQSIDINALTDEELFTFDYRSYIERIEIRRAKRQSAVYARYGMPPALHGAVREFSDDPEKLTEIQRLIRDVDLTAMEMDLEATHFSDRLLEACSSCRKVGYWQHLPGFRRLHVLCDVCRKIDHDRRLVRSQRDVTAVVSGALSRTRTLGLKSTLTIKEWGLALRHFKYMCAYCMVVPWEVLEHVTPINAGGGTTSANCLPACYSCNGRKKTQTIEQLPRGDSGLFGFASDVIDAALKWLVEHGRPAQEMDDDR